MGSNKKDYLFIILVVVVVIGIGYFSSNTYQRLETKYPDKITQLEAYDFALENQKQSVYVGKSTGEEVKEVFPNGKTLGMSSVYKPAGGNNTFTFTKKSDVLTTVDITEPGLTTARGITVNDPFEMVVQGYGKGYVKSYIKRDPNIYDAIYGSKQYIVFHVKDGVVERIVIEYPVMDKGK